jgi:GDP-D-mannose 3', 5'-epimerase
MKTALVTGSSGFIGGHLVARLIAEGYTVIGADITDFQYVRPHMFRKIDLRDQEKTNDMFYWHHIDEVYNLACLMGGMGFIGDDQHAYDIMVGSSQIVSNILDGCVAGKVKKIFFSSSACVYNQTKQEQIDSEALKESDAYPAYPDLVYGWQKLFSEQMTKTVETKGIDVRIGRFHNVYGPKGIYDGGKEKAPAALCRKVATAKNGDQIEVWGNGQQQRSFLYIDDCIEGVLRLMESDYSEPLNIGSSELVSINQLTKTIIDISGKHLTVKNIPSPHVGVKSRNSDNTLIKEKLNWTPGISLEEGLSKTYHWINKQIHGRI